MESNKTEVLRFDKHWDKYCILSNCEEYEARFHFQSGQQSKQAEIDCLQNRIDDLKAFCIKGVESSMLSIEYNQALIDMHKILKGE